MGDRLWEQNRRAGDGRWAIGYGNKAEKQAMGSSFVDILPVTNTQNHYIIIHEIEDNRGIERRHEPAKAGGFHAGVVTFARMTGSQSGAARTL